jgi:hypothetical protein
LRPFIIPNVSGKVIPCLGQPLDLGLESGNFLIQLTNPLHHAYF